jgi:hypothetical protein
VGKSALAFSGTQLYVIVPPLVTDVNGETYYDLAATGSVHKYYVYNKNLYRQIGTATPTIFARRISNIEVGVSGPTVTVTLTSDEQVGASASQVVYAQEIVMRNCNN